MISISLHFFLVLTSCCLVNGQISNCFMRIHDAPSCARNCIMFNIPQSCYMCRAGCADDGNNTDTCGSLVSSSCGADKVCLATGIIGQKKCVDRIGEGKECDRSYYSNHDAVGPGPANKVETKVPCEVGLVCKRESLDTHYCQPANQTDCFCKRLANPEVSCDDVGNYEALQCRRPDERLTCRCVSRSGTDIEGTETTVNSTSQAPDCGKNRKCSYVSRLGRIYHVSSGTIFVDYKICGLCLCAAGEAKFCVNRTRATCDMLDPEYGDKNCSIQGQSVRNRKSVVIGCTRCRCRDGQIHCLKRVCEDEKHDDSLDEKDRCQNCSNVDVRPVCGKDGKTYQSACVAINCRGLNDSDIVLGHCNEKDICRANPCNDTEICHRRGHVSCLSKFGCQRSRECVNLCNLRCNSLNGSEVCGSDGNTYSSRCTLLQSAAGVRVLYHERCDAPECSGGQVCGTDGETYSNICELRAQSANARVDYHGECIETANGTVEGNRCQRVRASGKCQDDSDCKTVIQPEDGCCPICGGGLTVGFDRTALEEYLKFNPSVETVNDLMARVFLSGLISKEDLKHCDVRASLTDGGDLFIAFKAKVISEDYCSNLANRLRDVIDNPPMNDTATASNSTSAPQAFEYATVTESSTLISGSTTTTPTSSGGQTVVKGISFIGIIASFFMVCLSQIITLKTY